MTLQHTLRDVRAAGAPVFVDEAGRRRRCMVVLGRISVAVLLAATGTILSALALGARMSLPELPDVIAGPAERVIDRLVERPEPDRPRPAGGDTGRADGGMDDPIGAPAPSGGSAGPRPPARAGSDAAPGTPSGAARKHAEPDAHRGTPGPGPGQGRGPREAGTGKRPAAPPRAGNRPTAAGRPPAAQRRAAAPTAPGRAGPAWGPAGRGARR